MKYKIFLDSNQVFNTSPLNEPFSTSVVDLREFINNHKIKNIEICLPELVIRERIQRKLDDINKEILSANESITALRKIGHTEENIKTLNSYREILEKNAGVFIDKYKITRIPMPSIEKEDLIERAINKMRPFDDKKGNGFKDTLIYLSIVDDAITDKEGNARYLFCTDDGGFNQEIEEEFKKKTGKELFIVKHISKIEEKLDELIPLRLKLEERNNKIKNIISKNIGEIMQRVNSNESLRKNNKLTLSDIYNDKAVYWAPTFGYSEFGDPGLNKEMEDDNVVGYNFMEMDFLNFIETENSTYEVSVSLKTSVKRKNKENSIYSPVVLYQTGIFPPSIKIFDLKIGCVTKDSKEEIKIISIR